MPPISYPITGLDPQNLPPVTVKPATDPADWLQMDPAGVHANARKFTLGLASFANFTGQPNIVHRVGWNVNGGGARIDSSQPSSFLSFEQEYEQSSGGPRLVENHWEGHDVDGTTYRWLSHSFQRGALATTSSVVLRAQQVQVFDEAGSQRVKWDFASGQALYLTHSAGVTIQGVNAASSAIYLPQNNIGALVQNKAAGGATAIAYVDSSDYVRVGAAASWAEAAGVILGNDRITWDFSGTDKVTANVGTTDGLVLAGAATQKLGFFGATPVAKPTGVAVDAASIHAALVSLGLIGA